MPDTALIPYQFTIDAAIAEWLAQKETRTSSKKTRQAYEDTMRQFRQFLSQGGPDLLGTYPCKVRHAVSNEKKPIPSLTSRLMKR